MGMKRSLSFCYPGVWTRVGDLGPQAQWPDGALKGSQSFVVSNQSSGCRLACLDKLTLTQPGCECIAQ